MGEFVCIIPSFTLILFGPPGKHRCTVHQRSSMSCCFPCVLLRWARHHPGCACSVTLLPRLPQEMLQDVIWSLLPWQARACRAHPTSVACATEPLLDSCLTRCRHGCGEHHVIMAQSYYEETTESGCDDCPKGDHPSGPSMAPPSKSTKAPGTTSAGPTTAAPTTEGTKAPRWTPAPTTTKAPKETPCPPTKSPTTTPVWSTTAAPGTTTEEPTTAAPGTTTAVPTTSPYMPPNPWGSTTAAPGTTTEEPTTAAPTTLPYMPPNPWGSTTAAPGTTTEEPTTAAPTPGVACAQYSPSVDRLSTRQCRGSFQLQSQMPSACAVVSTAAQSMQPCSQHTSQLLQIPAVIPQSPSGLT